MDLVRIIAVNREGGHVWKHYKVIILCGISDKLIIESGEWLGYAQQENVVHPFILKPEGILLYGGDEHYSEEINIHGKLLEKGVMFTVSNKTGAEEMFSATYEITSCHRYSS